MLYYIVSIRYENYIGNQLKIAKHALKSTAHEIESYIGYSQQLANILVSNHEQEIKTLARDWSSPQAFGAFRKKIQLYYPKFINFTLADRKGNNILDDPKRFIGKGCSIDIRAFAAGRHLTEIFIHSNPNPDNYHFDVLARVDDLGNGEEGSFFTSLDTRILQRLLSNGQGRYFHEPSPLSDESIKIQS